MLKVALKAYSDWLWNRKLTAANFADTAYDDRTEAAALDQGLLMKCTQKALLT